MEEPIGRNFKILMARPKTKNNIGYTHARRVVCVCVFFFSVVLTLIWSYNKTDSA